MYYLPFFILNCCIIIVGLNTSVEVEGSIQSVSYEVCAPGLVAYSLTKKLHNNYVLYGPLK